MVVRRDSNPADFPFTPAAARATVYTLNGAGNGPSCYCQVML